MNLFTSLLRGLGSKKSASEIPGTWFPVSGGADSINHRNLLDANREWVFIATDKVASAVAGVRFKVMRYAKNGDDQEVFDGPLVDFLENPGRGFTGKDFIYLNTVYKELAGNAFWEIDGKKLKPLIPTRMSPVISGEVLTGFRYSEGSTQRVIPLKDILHDRYVDPAKPWWGAGKLVKIARWVDISSYLTEFLARFFVNGATFGGFIETEEETEQRIKLIKAGLANEHTGVANAHKVGVLPKGAKFSKTTANMAEMEMGATDDRQRDKILATFGVPKSMLGLTTDVNRANAEAMEYVFAKYTVKPIADDLVEFLNVSVAPILENTGRFYFAYDEFVPVNQELQLREREIALAKQPYMTVNEVRASVGLPPIKNGDEVRNAFGEPLGTPTALPAPANDDEKDEEPKKAVPSRARAAMKRESLIEGIVEKALEITTAQQDPDEASHKAFVGRVEGHEAFIEKAVRDFNNQQERELLLNLQRVTKAVSRGDLFDMERETAVMVDFVSPILKALMIEQAVEEFAAQAFPGAFDPSSPRIATTLERAAKRLAKSYNKTTAKLLVETLNEGIEAGEALADLSARVHAIYDASDKVRAVAVAKTEAFYIANEGSREAYRQSGVVQTMRWYTAADERVCPFCGPVHGRTIGVSEVFYPKGVTIEGADGATMQTNYRAIDVPPLHTNCRCFIRPEQIELT
jgi:HK97 family phage portal protein